MTIHVMADYDGKVHHGITIMFIHLITIITWYIFPRRDPTQNILSVYLHTYIHMHGIETQAEMRFIIKALELLQAHYKKTDITDNLVVYIQYIYM